MVMPKLSINIIIIDINWGLCSSWQLSKLAFFRFSNTNSSIYKFTTNNTTQMRVPKVVLYVLICCGIQCTCDMMTMEKEKIEKAKFWDDYRANGYQDVLARRRSGLFNESCVAGRAGGVYNCNQIDLRGFLALEDMGCG
jgi:hypothetical protein